MSIQSDSLKNQENKTEKISQENAEIFKNCVAHLVEEIKEFFEGSGMEIIIEEETLIEGNIGIKNLSRYDFEHIKRTEGNESVILKPIRANSPNDFLGVVYFYIGEVIKFRLGLKRTGEWFVADYRWERVSLPLTKESLSEVICDLV